MLYYPRIDMNKRTDLDKSNNSKECVMICHYCFFNQGLKCQDPVCNNCHDLNINDKVSI